MAYNKPRSKDGWTVYLRNKERMNMNLKKLAALGLTLALCAGLAAGCSNSGSGSGTAATPAPVDTPTDRKSVV